MRDVTFGQYFPSHSFVHKMNASVKILLVIAYIVGVFLVKQFQFVGFGVCFLAVLFFVAIAKVPFLKVLKSLKAIIFFVVFSSVLQIFFNKSGTPLWEGGFITDQGLLTALFISCKIILVVLGASLLTLTTSPVELADGIEDLMYPLKLIRFPGHEFALIMSIALRFIPTLMEETDRIMKAQRARGADFDEGGAIKRARALIPLLIPLFISAFRIASDLAVAMEARCYHGGKDRTRMRVLRLERRDYIAITVLALLSALIIADASGAFAVVDALLWGIVGGAR